MEQIVPGAVFLVTGGTGSIGSEIAAQAAGAGAVVGVHGRSQESVAAAIARISARAPDARLIGLPGDVREPGVVEALVERIVAEAGRLDAVIHCMTTGAPGTTGLFAKMTPDNFGEMAALVIGTFERLAFAALPHLARQGGTLIVFASDAGRFAAARQSVLGGTFGGLMAFVRNLAVEVGRDNVRVHCISPSYVAETKVFERHNARGSSAADRAPLGLPTPRDIAPLALFLCGPGAAKITGQVISVNGGLNA